MPVMRVSLLLIGDELLSGEIRDTNGPDFLTRMRDAGHRVPRVAMIPDEHEVIVDTLTRMRGEAECVMISGGLGPTHDDCTRAAVAAALEKPLVRVDEAIARIKGYYGDRTTEAELRMGDAPEGACVFESMRSGAFGYEVDGVLLFPGVPVLFVELVETWITQHTGRVLHRAELRSQAREGELAPLLSAVQATAGEVAIGSYPELIEGRWRVRVVVRGHDADAVAHIAKTLEERLPNQLP